MSQSDTPPNPIADQFNAALDRMHGELLGVRGLSGLSDAKRATVKTEPFSLELAQRSVQGLAREARAEARSMHEQLLKQIELPYNVRDVVKWVAEVQASGKHNQYPNMTKWTAYFFGDQYAGDRTNNGVTDYTVALQTVRTHDFMVHQASQNPAYANNPLLMQQLAKEPPEVTQARELVAQRDARLEDLTAEVRGEITRNTPTNLDGQSVYDVLLTIRDRTIDAQELCDFAGPNGSLQDLAKQPSAVAVGGRRMNLSTLGFGGGDNKVLVGKTTVEDVQRQLDTGFRSARDSRHLKEVLTGVEPQLLVDKTLGQVTDSRQTKALTNLGAPASMVVDGGLDGRAAAAPAQGAARGGAGT